MNYKSLLICPICQGSLSHKANSLVCKKNHKFEITNDIPLLFSEEGKNTTITKKVKKFYEKTPFPNYDEIDNNGTLAKKAEKSVFAKRLQEQIYYQSKVLEVGCGTGQLSNFLATANRQVFGVDMSVSSLQLGQNFKEKNTLSNVSFYQMNIFKPIFKPESFDYILCNGVLHHTHNPKLGFEILLGLLKKDGYILVGLYNKYGRLITDFRRILINKFGDDLAFLDPNLRGSKMSQKQKTAWMEDQYKHPNESKHTINEVLGWFEENNVEFVNCLPETNILFQRTEKSLKPTKAHIFVNEAKQFLNGSREGGLFIMIGKKK